MSTLLAFDWNNREVRFVTATVRGKQIEITAAEVLPLDDAIDPDDAASVGGFLRRELDSRRIKCEEVIGCVERQDVILHPVALPAVPADELAKMIDFQANVDFALPDEPSTYDYLLERNAETGGHQALVAVVPTERIRRIRDAASALGARLGAIRMQSTARIAARRHWDLAPPRSLARDTHNPASDDNPELPARPRAHAPTRSVEVLLAAGDGTIEAVASLDGQVLFSQLTPLSDGEAGAARSALRRLQAHLSAQSPPLKAERLVVLASAEGAWPTGLELPDGETREVCDPFQDLPGVPERAYASLLALAGAIAQSVDGPKRSIDFLRPRRPAGPNPLRRYRWPIAAGIAAVLLLAVGFHAVQTMAARNSEYEDWDRQDRELSRELRQLRPYVEQRDTVAGWLDQRVHWLEAYEQLLSVLPDASQLYLTQVSFSETGSARRPGAIHLEGYAASRSAVTSIAMRLSEDGRYRLRPIALDAGSGDPNYPQRFEAELTISE